MVNLILTDSYFNLFPILTDCLKTDKQDLNKKKIVFCEAKVSLMVERYLCAETGGSFNTDVYSFGKFLCSRKTLSKVLSKEGSAMAIKRILSEINLNCFKQSRLTLAPTLYDLFIQLKSAKISPQDILRACESTSGVLKSKLTDVYSVYSEYERYIKENGFEDQSSLLSYLPQIINSSDDLSSADVYIFGFGSFTAQIRSAIFALMEKAKSVTAILVEGDNPFVYVNETSSFIRTACEQKGFNLFEKRLGGGYVREGELIAGNLFSPAIDLKSAQNGAFDDKYTDKVHYYAAINPQDEITRVAEIIKRTVMDGECRYRDITVALGNPDIYRDNIKSIFNTLNIPYYLDEQILPINHPLITLIFSYIDVYRKGFERETLTAFFKNPLFSSDKNLTDVFENYLIKYNVNYKRIFTPFTFPAKDDAELNALENFRQKLCAHLNVFDVRKMLDDLQVENALKMLSEKLKVVGEVEQAAVTEQIFGSVKSLLDEMQMMLGGIKLSYTEFKNLFASGVSALKLSIIPQYNDAVFIGGFKETALAKAKRLFAIGLTAEVPDVQADIALLSDSEISALEEIKVLVEPKIRVVNHRTREKVAMALCAFEDKLYLSYPTSTVDGKKNVKSEVISDLQKLFNFKDFPDSNGYLTKSQGYDSFAKSCGEFAEGKQVGNFYYDFTLPSSYYSATDGENLQDLLKGAQKEVKERLIGDNVSLIGSVTSPTALEDYYKCPFRAFASHALKIKEREEGKVNVLSVGNLMHEILNLFVRKMQTVCDEQTSNALFDNIAKDVLSRDEYKKFLSDPTTNATVERVLKECKGYCYKTYQSIEKSQFKFCKTEVNFGDGDKAEYPAISLLNGKVRLKGKIDRVDEGDKYFRVLDYKTGKTDPSEKSLFAGVKLQLYLYAAAVMGKYNGENAKFPAGLYYLPVSDKYERPDDKCVTLAVGKTLSETEAVIAQDKIFMQKGETDFVDVKIDPKSGAVKNGVGRETLESYIEYALKVSELAAKRLSEGVIKPSPYENACEYCEFGALCGLYNAEKRTLGAVKSAFLSGADKGENEDA